MEPRNPILDLEGPDDIFDLLFNPRSIVERVKNGKGVLWYNPETNFFYKTMLKAHVASVRERTPNSGIVIYPQSLDRTLWIRRGRNWFKREAKETFRLRALEKEYK